MRRPAHRVPLQVVSSRVTAMPNHRLDRHRAAAAQRSHQAPAKVLTSRAARSHNRRHPVARLVPAVHRPTIQARHPRTPARQRRARLLMLVHLLVHHQMPVRQHQARHPMLVHLLVHRRMPVHRQATRTRRRQRTAARPARVPRSRPIRPTLVPKKTEPRKTPVQAVDPKEGETAAVS